MSTTPTLSDEHLPALFRAADRASLSGQKTHLWLIRLNLSVIIISSVVTSWAVSSSSLRIALAISGAVTFVAGLVLTAFILQTQAHKEWFAARAVAESVKTIAWRYMMASEPFNIGLTDQEATDLFCREVEAILRERRAIGGSLGGPEASAGQITDRMRDIRRLSLPTRKEVYLQSRIRQQRTWYGNKAHANAGLSKLWTGLVAFIQLAGAGAAIALVRWPDLEFNLASVLAATAAVFIAWMQVKQHQDLAQVYGLSAHELGLIEARASHASSDSTFSEFVGNAEAAISKEHTMWVAKRDVTT